MIVVVASMLTGVAIISIFGIVCVYASWETRDDRRRQQRLDDRSDAWKQPWKAKNPAP